MNVLMKNALRPAWRLISSVKTRWLLVQIYLYDYKRYKKYYSSRLASSRDKEQLEAWILQDKHRIEKGLSLPNVRANFGQSALSNLMKNLIMYRSTYSKEDIYYWGVGVIEAYRKFHSANKIETSKWFDDLYKKLDKIDLTNEKSLEVGVSPYISSNITDKDFIKFFCSRSSVRQFESNGIPNEVLESIVKTAIKTPSVCNRQHWQVHLLKDDLKSKVLQLQNGNVGFGGDAPLVAMVTSSLKAFYLPAERAQAYTDGGMFSMSFLLSCHAHGVASCPLNWAASLDQDIKLRKLNIIGDDEVVVMLIAVGYPRDGAMVANSPRKKLKEIMIIHE